MKNSTILFSAFIAISIFSTVHAGTLSAQTSLKKFVVPKDTTTKSAAPSFSAEVLEDAGNPQKFILLVNNPAGEKLHITVRSQSDYGYDETTYQPALRKRFDMSGAEDGSYTVTVNSGKRTITKQIQLATKTEVTRSIAIK